MFNGQTELVRSGGSGRTRPVQRVRPSSSHRRRAAQRDPQDTRESPRWLVRHLQFALHCTPTYRSWLHLVQRWVRRTHQQMAPASHHQSTKELASTIPDWTEHWNEEPKRFVSHKSADPRSVGVITHIGVGDLPLSSGIAKIDNQSCGQLMVVVRTPPLRVKGQRGGMTSRPGSRDSLQRSVDVLVVDDDPTLRSTWAEILRSSGYSVAVASDGDAALGILQQEAVGLVLLDLRMPRRDGLSVLEALNTPQLVVLVSAYSLDAATRARVDAKVVTYLEKPVAPEHLLTTVASTLGRSCVDSS